MILAQEKYAEKQNLNNDTKAITPKKGKAPNNNLVKVVLVGSIIGVFCLGVLLTAQYARIASVGFQMVQLKQEIAVLETNNERLYLRTLQLQSLDRIEELAVTKLGMIYAEASEKQQLAVINDFTTVNSGYSGETAGRQNIILVEQQGRQLNPIIQAISQIIK